MPVLGMILFILVVASWSSLLMAIFGFFDWFDKGTSRPFFCIMLGILFPITIPAAIVWFLLWVLWEILIELEEWISR